MFGKRMAVRESIFVYVSTKTAARFRPTYIKVVWEAALVDTLVDEAR